VLAAAGIASRRACEEMISAGRVRVNGEVVTRLGTKVDPKSASIAVDGKPVGVAQSNIYYRVYKPRGLLSDIGGDSRGRRTVAELLPPGVGRVFPVGRLDLNSEGLVLLTDDGELAHRLTHPRYEHPKTYFVLSAQRPAADALFRLRNGIELESGRTAPARVEVAERLPAGLMLDRGRPEQGPPGTESWRSPRTDKGVWLRIVLREGKKRQIRHMAAAVGIQVRRLIRESGEWDESVYGVPLSSAHLALASSVFSAMLLDDVARLGARLTPEGRAGYMHIWRYTAVLLGVPDTILFRDEADALEICRIGGACEPEPGESAIVMANSLLNVAPVVIGLSEPGERAALANYGLRVSRALIGHDLADRLRFPRQHTAGMLFAMRLQRRLGGLFDRLTGRTYITRASRFAELVEHATLEDTGISYRLPLKLYSDEAQTW